MTLALPDRCHPQTPLVGSSIVDRGMQLHNPHCTLSSLSGVTSGIELLYSKQQLGKAEKISCRLRLMEWGLPLKLLSSSFSEFARLLSFGSEFARVLRLRDSMCRMGEEEKDQVR